MRRILPFVCAAGVILMAATPARAAMIGVRGLNIDPPPLSAQVGQPSVPLIPASCGAGLSTDFACVLFENDFPSVVDITLTVFDPTGTIVPFQDLQVIGDPLGPMGLGSLSSGKPGTLGTITLFGGTLPGIAGCTAGPHARPINCGLEIFFLPDPPVNGGNGNGGSYRVSVDAVNTIPEPGTMLLVGTGLALTGLRLRRRK